MVTIWEIWERSETGPSMSEKDFDMKVLPIKLLDLKKEFDIGYDPNEPVPSDASLAKRVFEGAVKLLSDVGIFCVISSRMIKVTEEEINDCLKRVPRKINIGVGKDLVELVSRGIEGRRKPILIGGPWGCPVNFYVFEN